MQLARERQRCAEPLVLDDCAGRHRLDLVEHSERQGDTLVPDRKAADAAPPPRNRWFADSPLEGGVCCEPVSESQV